jgi:hypothetical protein
MLITPFTCLDRAGNHGDDGDEDGGNDVEEGPDEADLDGPLPLRVLPPQPGQAENSQTDADLLVSYHGLILDIAILNNRDLQSYLSLLDIWSQSFTNFQSIEAILL